MKSVLIVGAGPAGLVAAKTLLQYPGNEFKVTIFEYADRIGGMWGSPKDDYGNKCAPSMRTNLSKYTVAFSDLSWNDVDLDPDTTEPGKPSPPMFPRAYEVGRYLEAYAKKFIPDGVIVLEREVEDAELKDGKWEIASFDFTENVNHTDVFDYLIVASGFFNRAVERMTSPIPHQHSSMFRDAGFLTYSPGKILVVGGGISGSEAAATAALQISNSKYAPGPKAGWAENKIYHVFDRPFYCLPRYLPQNPYDAAIQGHRLAPDFLPLDLVLYNLSRRGEGAISAFNGPVPPAKAKKGHEFIRSVLGGDQRDLGASALVYKPEQTEYPAFTGISDTYAEFVRSGLIVPTRGRVGTITGTRDHAKVEITHNSPWAQESPQSDPITHIDDVVGMIEATGYQPNTDYLSDEVKAALSHDPSSRRVPFLLSQGSIFNAKVPQIAFVGFYEGPYWGVMEMQARLIAQKWSASPPDCVPDTPMNTETAAKVRQAIQQKSLGVPQFWMPDYVGMMEEFARTTSTPRDDTLFPGAQTGPVFAARYANPSSSSASSSASASATETTQDLITHLTASTTSTRFVAAATFRAMQGPWTLRRKIDSHHPSSPGGTLSGTAHFHPRFPTSPQYSAEYLYIENGTFTMDNGYAFPATRRYVYRYDEGKDQISTFFVGEDGESAERVFNELVFERPDGEERGWIAKSEHWCDPDTYLSECEFRFRGVGLERFGITYGVKGPMKDYTHESWYERPVPGAVG